MKLTLLGVMGSVPGGSSDLGKNTTCLLIQDNSDCILIDAGTGILNYFNHTNKGKHYVLFTHYHLDHVIGLPFISQLYNASNTFHMYGPQLGSYNSSDIIPTFFKEPFLPINVSDIEARVKHHVLSDKSTYLINEFTISTMLIEHPGMCMVYSIQRNGKKLSILTDFSNHSSKNTEVMNFCKDSDIIYIDSYLKDQEMTESKDFGHCSIENAIKLFENTSSKKLILSHHRNDRQYKSMKKYESDNIVIAHENDEFII